MNAVYRAQHIAESLSRASCMHPFAPEPDVACDTRGTEAQLTAQDTVTILKQEHWDELQHTPENEGYQML